MTVGALDLQTLAGNVARGTLQLCVRAFQLHWKAKVFWRSRRRKPVWRVAILTVGTKVGITGRFVAIGALIRELLDPGVTAITAHRGVFALQWSGMGKSGFQVYRGPGLTVAGRVGAETRIITAKGGFPVADCAIVAGQDTVVGYEIGFLVRRRFLDQRNRDL